MISHTDPPRRDTLTPGNSWKFAALRLWLAGALLYYPASWLAYSLVWAGPAFAQTLFGGYRLKQFRVGVFGVFALSSAASGVYNPHPQAFDSGISQALAILLELGTAAGLAALGRRNRALSGFGIAVLGTAGLLLPLRRLYFQKHVLAADIVVCATFFAVLCFGLWWMLAGWPPDLTRTYLRRAMVLSAAFVIMPFVVWFSIQLLARPQFTEFSIWFIVPPAIAAFIAGLRPPMQSSTVAQAASWRIVAWCAAALMLSAAGIRLGSRPLNLAFARARMAENRRAMAAIPAIPADLPYPKLFFQRGVNFTAEWPDPYASEGARRMLDMLAQYGINAIALVPYGWFKQHPPQVRIQEGDEGWESDEGLEELSRVAHARGMRVMLKPAIWESFNLTYPAAEERARWFEEYGLFLEHYVRLATRIHAELFCVGGEFVHLTEYDQPWRKLIARARELYPGDLVYAANFGPEFENITFWDALDYIGLQEYYPLPADLAADSVVRRVEAVQQRYRRPVIFTEVGFPSVASANLRPWDDNDHSSLSPALQARCYEAIYRAFYSKPWFEGMYWWKVETNGTGGSEDGSHSPWEKPAMQVLKRWYLAGGR